MKRTYRNSVSFTIANLSGNLAELKSLTGSFGNLSAIIDSLDTNQNYTVVKINSCKLRIVSDSTQGHILGFHHILTDYDATLTDPTEYNQYDVNGHINSALDRDFISKQLKEDYVAVPVGYNNTPAALYSIKATLDVTNIARSVLNVIRSRIASDQIPANHLIGICFTQDNATNVYLTVALSIDYTVRHN